MNTEMLREMVLRLVLTELAAKGDFRVPVNSSNRHIHLSQDHVDQLFSPNYQLTPMRALAQPGQYACHEQVVMETPSGTLQLRVVGPVRSKTQIEISHSEAIRLKIPPVLRLSGDINNTPGCWLVNGNKRAQLHEGIIVAQRHMHISPGEAQVYGLKDGDKVCLYVGGPRKLTFHDVVVRCAQGHVLEAHLDREEANAAGLTDGQICRIITGNEFSQPKPVYQADRKEARLHLGAKGKGLLTEQEVLAQVHSGKTRIVCPKGTIISPLAKDAAWENNVELVLE